MLDQLCPTSLLQGRSLVDGHDHLGAANKRSLIHHGVEELNWTSNWHLCGSVWWCQGHWVEVNNIRDQNRLKSTQVSLAKVPLGGTLKNKWGDLSCHFVREAHGWTYANSKASLKNQRVAVVGIQFNPSRMGWHNGQTTHSLSLLLLISVGNIASRCPRHVPQRLHILKSRSE